MSVREDRRAAALDRIADHMLTHGLADSSLRALAQTAGTSDRMLLYYFAGKDDIVASALSTIAARLGAILHGALGGPCSADADTVLAEMAGIIRGVAVRPYMRLWLEVTILSSRGEEPYRSVAGKIADNFVALVAGRLAIDDEAARMATAARVIATLDGLVVLDLVGRESTATLALGDAKKQK
jgi:AcrR family transcriptional regulator